MAKSKLSRKEWQAAVDSAEDQLRNSEMIAIQAELLLEKAEKELKKLPKEKKNAPILGR